MTNVSTLRQFTALLIFSLQILTVQSASAQFRFSQPSGSEVFYVQAPASSGINQMILQPVVTPANIPEGQNSLIGHLWPNSASYTLETKAVKPIVQPDLSLGLQYKYSFNLGVTARSPQGNAMAIPTGWYQLQLAVIRKSRIDIDGVKESPYDRYVTSTSTFIKVSGNSFGHIVNLRFDRLEDTATEHHLYVELIPLKTECSAGTHGDPEAKVPCINEKNGKPDPLNSILEPNPNFRTYLIEMPFLPYQALPGKVRDAEDINDEPLPWLESSLTRYILKAQTDQAKKKKAARPQTAQKHAQDERLTMASTDDLVFAHVKPLLEKMMSERATGILKIDSTYRPLLIALCTELANRNQSTAVFGRYLKGNQQRAREAQIMRCSNQPESMLRITRITHLGKPVADEVKRILQRPLGYTISANYMSNRSASVDHMNTFTFKVPYLAKLLEHGGIGMNHTVNYANSRSQAENGVGSMAVSLDFNYMALAIPVVGSQTCLDVRASDPRYPWIFDSDKNSKNGFYVCAPPTNEKIVVSEVYAHAFERCKVTNMMTCDSLSQSVNIPMRGDRDISQFFYQIRKHIIPDHRNMPEPFQDMNTANGYFNNTPLSGQMQVITPIEFPYDKVPSFLQLVFDVNRAETFQ